ncbi:hypothetical protein, partial [Adlercreutzia equolifaciens]|uniref:hypothetical protein n=1 Tax=Adlercreutzia equolifaciens TaxID=446660 RepID=UPI003A8A725C
AIHWEIVYRKIRHQGFWSTSRPHGTRKLPWVPFCAHNGESFADPLFSQLKFPHSRILRENFRHNSSTFHPECR